jgi:hypothetical protein
MTQPVFCPIWFELFLSNTYISGTTFWAYAFVILQKCPELKKWLDGEYSPNLVTLFEETGWIFQTECLHLHS